MKDLEKSVDLQEMNLQEMSEVDGGITRLGVAANFIPRFLDYLPGAISDFIDGWNAAGK